MSADYVIQVDGEWVPVDSSTPEGRARLQAAQEFLPNSIRRLDGDAADFVRREQTIERRQEAMQDTDQFFGSLATAGGAFADQLGFGFFRDEDDRLTREAARREFPLAGMLGTAAGFAGPGRGFNALGRAITTRLGTRLAGRAGGQALARATGTAASTGLEGVAETAAYAGMTGEPLDAEMLMTGGAFGAGLGLGGAAIGRAASRVGRGIRNVGGEQIQRLQQRGMLPDGLPGPARRVDDTTYDVDIQPGETLQGDLAPFNVAEVDTPLAPRSQRLDDLGTVVRGTQDAQTIRRSAASIDSVSQPSVFRDQTADFVRNDLQRLDQGIEEAIQRTSRSQRARRWSRALQENPVDEEAVATAQRRLRQRGPDINNTPVEDVASSAVGEVRSRFNALFSSPTQSRPMAGRRVSARRQRPGMTPESFVQRADDLIDYIDSNRLIEGALGTKAPEATRLIAQVRNEVLDSLSQPEWGQLGMDFRRSTELSNELLRRRNQLRSLAGNYIEGEFDFNDPRIAQTFNDNFRRVDNQQFDSTLDQTFKTYGDVLDDLQASGGLEREVAERFRQDALVARRKARRLRAFGKLRAAFEEGISNEFRQQGAMAGLNLSITGGIAVGGIAGGPLGALAGGLAGLAFTAFTHPFVALQRGQAIRNFLGMGRKRLNDGFDNIRESLENPRRWRQLTSRAGEEVSPVVRRLLNRETQQEEYNTIVEDLRRFQSSPELLADTIGDLTQNVSQVSPGMANHVAMSFVRGLHYLSDNLPPIDTPSPFSHLKAYKGRASDYEIQSFVRKFQVVEDPLSVLDLTANWQLTTDHVDALRNVYPEMYAHIQAEVTEIVVSLDELPPFNARMQIGTLLDIPSDPSLDPAFIQRMQSDYAQTQEQQRQIRPRAQISSEIATNTYSESQSISLSL